MKNKKALLPWMFPHLGVLPCKFLVSSLLFDRSTFVIDINSITVTI
jgi:hypothetical protein